MYIRASNCYGSQALQMVWLLIDFSSLTYFTAPFDMTRAIPQGGGFQISTNSIPPSIVVSSAKNKQTKEKTEPSSS